MSTNIKRRLQRIKENLSKNPPDLLDMSDDELVQVITSNPNSKASDLTPAQLENIAKD